jgi:hypothetical protein
MKTLVLDSGKKSFFFLNTFAITAKGRQLVVPYLLMNITMLKLWLGCRNSEKKTLINMEFIRAKAVEQEEPCRSRLHDEEVLKPRMISSSCRTRNLRLIRLIPRPLLRMEIRRRLHLAEQIRTRRVPVHHHQVRARLAKRRWRR